MRRVRYRPKQKRINVLVQTLIVLGVSTLACGENVNEEEAIQMCEDLIEVYCEKEDECSVFSSKEGCESQIRTDLDCGAAVDVDESYDRCIQDIDRATCSTFGLPASCEGVIKTR